MKQDRENTIKSLKTSLEQISRYNMTSIEGALRDQVGRLQGKADAINGATIFATQALDLKFEFLPIEVLDRLKNAAEKMETAIREFVEYRTPIGPVKVPDTMLKTLGDNVNAAWWDFCDKFVVFIAYLSVSDSRLDEVVAGVQKTAHHVESIKDLVESNREEADEILNALKLASGTAGVSRFANRFQNLAAIHKRAAFGWLAVVAILAACTGWFALDTIKKSEAASWPTNWSSPQLVQHVASRLIVLSLASFSLVWSSRNYRAHRHLNTINEHRQESLTTFETLVNASLSDETKDVILKEVTRCIFSPAVTGYLGPDQEMPTNNIIEVMGKAFTGGSSKTGG